MIIDRIKSSFYRLTGCLLLAGMGVVLSSSLSACSMSNSYTYTTSHSPTLQQNVHSPKRNIAESSSLNPVQEQSSGSIIHHKTFLEQVVSIYQLNSKELNTKIEELSNLEGMPAKIQLAIALSRTQQMANNKRALTILSSILEAPKSNNKKYLLWASFFYTLISEQNQLQMQVVQQAQQLRQNERTIQELNDKINALRAIEERFSQR